MIEVREVRAAYGAAPVLAGVSCTIAPGKIVAVAGANGSGKSTLGRLLCGGALAEVGAVCVDGYDPAAGTTARAAARRLVGLVQQDPCDQIVASLVFDEVAFGPRNLGCSESEVRVRVADTLAQVGLTGFEHRATTALSGGELQRLALAGVLAMRPRYLVLDEVTSQLDAACRVEVRELIDALAHEQGIGVVQITHDPLELLAADRLLVLERGRCVWAGAPEAFVREEPVRWAALAAEDAYAQALSGALAAGYAMDRGTSPASLASWFLEPSQGVCAQERERVRQLLAATGGDASGSAGTMDGLPCIEFAGVRCAYGERVVLDGIDLALGAGRVLLVTGRSGAGKSTLAAAAAGLLEPAAGAVRVAGAPAAPGRCGLAFQQPEAQFYLDTVFDELALAPRNRGLAVEAVGVCVERAAGMAGLDRALLERDPFTLSGGQARLAAIAATVTLEAPAYVFDEPSAGLDAAARRQVHALVRSLAQGGAGVVVISHDVGEWLAVADELALVDGGRIAWQGPADAIGEAVPAFAQAGLPLPPEVQTRLLLADGAARERLLQSSGRANGPCEADAYAARDAASPLAALDARVKVAGLLLVSGALFLIEGPVSLAGGYLLLAACLRAARVTPRRALAALRPILVVLLLALCANLMACDGGAPLGLVGPVGIDPAGALRGLRAVLRIVLLAGFATAVAASTTAVEVGDACVRLLRPLARFGVPLGQLGAALILALRFIPLVGDELMRIRMAQRVRGVRFDEGGPVRRARAWLGILAPLVVGLLRRADRLGASMEARCYADGAASRLPEPRPLARRDRMALAALIGALGCLAALTVLLS